MARKLFALRGIRTRSGDLADGVTYVAYTDTGGTVLADVSDSSGGSALAGSSFTLGSLGDCDLWGPATGETNLYLRCPSDPALGVQEIKADADARLDALESSGALAAHEADTTAIHGITNTAQLAVKDANQTFTRQQIVKPSTPEVNLRLQDSGSGFPGMNFESGAGTVRATFAVNGSTGDFYMDYGDNGGNGDGIFRAAGGGGGERVRFLYAGGMQLPERADPSAPAADKAILYVRDNGSGKTQLVVRFPTGAVQVLATEP